MRGQILAIAAALAALHSTMAHAQDSADKPAVAVAYNAAIVSDYRFRGISLTNRKPAVQGGVDLAFRSGFFLGTWASNVANSGGGHVEVDLYGGYGSSLAGFDVSAGAYGYVYPGGHNVNYVELLSTIARTTGPLTTTLTVGFTPKQGNAVENLYLGLGGKMPIGESGFTLSAGIGRENGAYDHKYDWSTGVSYKLDLIELSASYVDSNYKSVNEAGRNGRAGVVLSAKAAF